MAFAGNDAYNTHTLWHSSKIVFAVQEQPIDGTREENVLSTPYKLRGGRSGPRPPWVANEPGKP